MTIFLLLLGAVAVGAITVYGLRTVQSTARLLTRSVLVPLTVLTTLICAAFGVWVWQRPDSFKNLRPPLCVPVAAASGRVVSYACQSQRLRLWRPIEAIDPGLKDLVVLLEDEKFFDHSGLDLSEIWAAIQKDFEEKRLARGGSTITQQLAKNLFLTKEKSLIRKASEVPLALRLEQELSKTKILELYLNTIEWGPGVYGVEAASRTYFGRDSYSLREVEAWLLALMIPNPRELHPWIRPKAKAALLKRAENLASRLVLSRKKSRAEAEQVLAEFQEFLSLWSMESAVPEAFPRVWGEGAVAPIWQSPAMKKKLQTALNKKNSTDTPIASNLDEGLHLALQRIAAEAPEQDHKGRWVALFRDQRLVAYAPDIASTRRAAQDLARREGLELRALSSWAATDFLR